MSAKVTIGEIARTSGVAPTTLRYYEKIGLLPTPARVGGQRRYDPSIRARLEIIGLCKTAGFELSEIEVLLTDGQRGRPTTRALAEAKLAEIDTKVLELARARSIIEWAMQCTCPSIDDCTCGIHPPESPSISQGR